MKLYAAQLFFASLMLMFVGLFGVLKYSDAYEVPTKVITLTSAGCAAIRPYIQVDDKNGVCSTTALWSNNTIIMANRQIRLSETAVISTVNADQDLPDTPAIESDKRRMLLFLVLFSLASISSIYFVRMIPFKKSKAHNHLAPQ